jgi:hypothetical protein
MEIKANIEEAVKMLKSGGNVIKTRDDRELILVNSSCEIQNIDGCDWGLNNDEKVTNAIFRKRIEPWLTSLFQSEHLSLLCGSGITNAISRIAGAGGGTTMGTTSFSKYNDEINEAAERSAKASGREKGNIEDQIRTANDLLRGLRILKKDAEANALAAELDKVITTFARSILSSENAIATADDDKRVKAYSVLVNFLLSFASRTGNRERLNVFTTNYDRLIEVGAELAGIHLMDRFVGTMMPIFRSSRLNLDIHYNPPGIRGEPRYLEGVARLAKLHGSVDWVQNEDEIRRIGLPFGADDISPYLNAPGLKGSNALKLMVYPNSAKDRETAEYPYVELFRDFAAAVCRPNSTLVTYGYGFGDEHINRVIHDMLTIPSTHLVVISFDDPIGRILNFYQDSAHYAQMSIMIGSNLGEITNLANDYLPKSAIDRTTIRMAELLQHRMGTTSPSAAISSTHVANSSTTASVSTTSVK